MEARMSNAIESFHELHYSPYVLSPILEGFFSNVTSQKRNLLLSYLVLPLTLYPPSKSFLKNSRRDSSLATFWREPYRFYGLSQRVQQYRELTNLCVQCCLDAETISIDEDLVVTVLGRTPDTSATPPDAVRAAEKLGTLLGLLEIPAIYRLLGVKRL
jgi:hypothetical protein